MREMLLYQNMGSISYLGKSLFHNYLLLFFGPFSLGKES